jgi:hypothetical protein
MIDRSMGGLTQVNIYGMIDRSMGWISAGTADIIYMSMGGLTQVNIYDRYVYGVDCRRYSRYDR